MFTCRDTDNNPQGEYVAASTFMPHPYCNVSGDGKVYMVYKKLRNNTTNNMKKPSIYSCSGSCDDFNVNENH